MPDIAWYRERYALHFTDRAIELQFPAPYLNNQQTDLWVRRSKGLRLDTTHMQAGYGEAFVRELEGFWDSVVAGAEPCETRSRRRSATPACWPALRTPRIARREPVTDHLHSAQRARASTSSARVRACSPGPRSITATRCRWCWPSAGSELDAEPASRASRCGLRAALAPGATWCCSTPNTRVAQALAAGAVPGTTGLVVPLEAMGYGDVAKLEVTDVPGGLVAGKARRLGASGAKLLLPYRVDVPDQAERQEQVVAEAVAACREAGLALDPGADRVQARGRGAGRRRPLRRARGRRCAAAGAARAGRPEAPVSRVGGGVRGRR